MHLLSELYEYNYYSKYLEISDIPETIFWAPRSTLHLCTGLSHSFWWSSLEGDGCTGMVADGGHWSPHTLCGDPVVHLCSTVQEMGEGNPFTLPIIIAYHEHILIPSWPPSTLLPHTTLSSSPPSLSLPSISLSSPFPIPPPATLCHTLCCHSGHSLSRQWVSLLHYTGHWAPLCLSRWPLFCDTRLTCAVSLCHRSFQYTTSTRCSPIYNNIIICRGTRVKLSIHARFF